MLRGVLQRPWTPPTSCHQHSHPQLGHPACLQSLPRVPWEVEIHPSLVETQCSPPHPRIEAPFGGSARLFPVWKRGFLYLDQRRWGPGRRWLGGDGVSGVEACDGPVKSRRRGVDRARAAGAEVLPKNLLVGSQSKPRMRPFLLQKYLQNHFTKSGSKVSTVTFCP